MANDILSASIISGSIRQLKQTIKKQNEVTDRLTKAMYILTSVSVGLIIVQIIVAFLLY